MSILIDQSNISSYHADVLYQMIKDRGIDTETWAKDINDLHGEIIGGETSLTFSEEGIERRIHVAAVKCFTTYMGKEYKLVEELQLFKNGKINKRNYDYVSEKVCPGESIEVAAIRGLEEELGIKDVQVTFVRDEIVERASSPTYKGIKSINKVSYLSCVIPSDKYLPTYIEYQEKKRNYFTWEPIVV